MNPYEILNLENDADEEQIKERYKNLLDEYNDNKENFTLEYLENLNFAYDALITKNIYTEIRKLIENKNFPMAESKLNLVDDKDNAEWNYLKGFVSVNRGWFETAVNYLNKAIELDPENAEYIESLNTLKSRIMQYALNYTKFNTKQQSNMNPCSGGNNNQGMC
ncbi:J domain-containing protein [Clostridium sp. BJN0001]|uniref:J domain-containing protein n=1 Tax=Clostridium sp. BJN0001 TaxID=2930219 RepID=UPI001FD61DBD|nr:J domain-containing protein [Clostridium sp. BJN0001]